MSQQTPEPATTPLEETPTTSIPAPARSRPTEGAEETESAGTAEDQPEPAGDGEPATGPSEPAPEPGSSEEPEPGSSEEPEPDPFSDGPPPLPQPMLVLTGTLPESEEPEAQEPVDHGTCAACGGAYDEDGWCTQCGQRRPDPRDHFTDQPAPHVAAACDRGRRHKENQDAMAVRVDTAEPERVVIVVCDGVSSAERSAEASLAAAEAAVEVLARRGAPPTTRLVQAADAASAAVDEVGAEFPGTAPSCTFVAGILESGTLTVGSVGDSRAYWFPDAGEAVRLTRDDSMAEEQIRAGVDPVTAESGPLAHTITRWLGPDSPDHTPKVTTQDATAPGWVLLCSDGLWNYASDPVDLAAVVRSEQERVGTDPLDLALALVAWANEQGGADNITVALARTATSGQDGAHG